MARFQDRNGIVATNGFFQETSATGSQATASRSAAKMYQAVVISGAAGTSYTVNIPAGSIVTDIVTNVSTGFNGTTPTLSVGTAAAGTQIASTQSIASATTAQQQSSTFAVNTAGQVFLTLTGSPTTGAGTVLVGYVPVYKSVAV